MTTQNIKRTRISTCRICGSEKLQLIISLKQMPFTDEFIPQNKIGQEFLSDIDIAVCNSCGSSQNLNDTDMGEYYFDYTYSVQSSGFAIDFMRKLATRIKEKYFQNSANPSIIEIGSGTGEQLLEFKKLGFNVLGIEPSNKLSEYANSIGIPTETAFFDKQTLNSINSEFKNIDAIVTSYTFDHIPQPVEALQTMHKLLKKDGIIIIEVHNLELIRQRNEFCLFEHEHYTYLNEHTMSALLGANKFKVLTYSILNENEKRANSLLVVAQKTEDEISIEVDIQDEVSKLQNLNAEILKSIKRIDSWLAENKNKKIAAYGAGGRGVMTIAALSNTAMIQFIVDKNPKAKNIFAPKSHLPVYGIEKLGEEHMDKIIVFSFGYYNEIVKELHDRFGYGADQFISILDLLELKHA